MIGSGRRELRYSRIDLREYAGTNPIGMLAGALAQAVPELRRNAIAIVDSPRSPVDLDCSTAKFALRADSPPTRTIDAALRKLVSEIRLTGPADRKIKFSLFPTPRFDYFARCVGDSNCKPHLRAFGAQVFRSLDRFAHSGLPAHPSGGALFTRFMLAGFAVYHALDALKVETYEGYPYLAFKLWMNPREALPPKDKRRERRMKALNARADILRRLAASIPNFRLTQPADCDQADAAILATTLALASQSTRAGSTAEIRSRAEGRFIVAVTLADAKTLASARSSRAAGVRA